LVKNVRSIKIGGKEKELDREFEKIKDKTILSILKNILLCNTKRSVDCALTISRYFDFLGLNNDNYLLYLLLLETNNSYVIDGLIGKRDAFLLFSPIKPNGYMLKETFRLLSQFKMGEINDKFLLSLLGIIQNAYKSSKFGFSLYPLSISDVYNIGKYLDKKKDQLEKINRLILDILLNIYQVGIDSFYKDAKQVAITANGIRMAFFDNRKNISDVIPDVLLLNQGYRKKELKPGIVLEDKIK